MPPHVDGGEQPAPRFPHHTHTPHPHPAGGSEGESRGQPCSPGGPARSPAQRLGHRGPQAVPQGGTAVGKGLEGLHPYPCPARAEGSRGRDTCAVKPLLWRSPARASPERTDGQATPGATGMAQLSAICLPPSLPWRDRGGPQGSWSPCVSPSRPRGESRHRGELSQSDTSAVECHCACPLSSGWCVCVCPSRWDRKPHRATRGLGRAGRLQEQLPSGLRPSYGGWALVVDTWGHPSLAREQTQTRPGRHDPRSTLVPAPEPECQSGPCSVRLWRKVKSLLCGTANRPGPQAQQEVGAACARAPQRCLCTAEEPGKPGPWGARVWPLVPAP